MEYLEKNYYPYKDLCVKGRQKIYTKDLNAGNIDAHFYSIINILKDGIETEEVQNMIIHVYFENDNDVELSIFDYCLNLMFWQLCTKVNHPIWDVHLVFFEDITKKNIKEYIDNIYIDKYRKKVPLITMNQTIDDVMSKFRDIRPFQQYLANTLNLEDTIDLMNKYPEFNDTVHYSSDGLQLEDIKEAGMKVTNLQIKYIKNSDHCLRDSFRTGEAISPKQYKEVAVEIGTKPDGKGSIFSRPINSSFMNGGLQTAADIYIDSSVGRVAQILSKTNVGESGSFARLLELNNQDAFLHPDPDYVCDTKNFVEVAMENDTMIDMFNLNYYREDPEGVDKLFDAKRVDRKEIMYKKLYFRSPCKCASYTRGQGICYKCYGDLAYVNAEVNSGQIAAEGLSSRYTQILLSAKHLLESIVIKMEWTEGFYDVFGLCFDTINIRSDKNLSGWSIIIDEDIKVEDEMDSGEYNNYINNFILRDPNGNEKIISTANKDNMYIDSEFYDIIMNFESGNEDFYSEIPIDQIKDLAVLFKIDIKNNELSATMDRVKQLIDTKFMISQYNIDQLLREVIVTNIQGGIIINAVHFMMILMSQIRAADDILSLPDWTVPNQEYQILTLSKSLSDNLSITVRLQGSKVSKALLNPDNSKLTKAAICDMFSMEQPQEFLAEEITEDQENLISDDKDRREVKEPISFDNPKIKVGIHKDKVYRNLSYRE